MKASTRFWAKVDKTDGCWEWTASVNHAGYGQFHFKGGTYRAHRIAWFFKHGTWPPYLCHTCDNPRCVRPDHLYVGDPTANAVDMAARRRHANTRKTHCPKGHPYKEHGVVRYRKGGKSFRVCKVCVLEDTHKRRGPEKERHRGPRRVA